MLENLNQRDTEDITGTIAQKYIDEGKAVGIQEGEARGIEKRMKKAVLNMLSQNLAPYLIAQYIGLTIKQINKLKHSNENGEDTLI